MMFIKEFALIIISPVLSILVLNICKSLIPIYVFPFTGLKKNKELTFPYLNSIFGWLLILLLFYFIITFSLYLTSSSIYYVNEAVSNLRSINLQNSETTRVLMLNCLLIASMVRIFSVSLTISLFYNVLYYVVVIISVVLPSAGLMYGKQLTHFIDNVIRQSPFFTTNPHVSLFNLAIFLGVIVFTEMFIYIFKNSFIKKIPCSSFDERLSLSAYSNQVFPRDNIVKHISSALSKANCDSEIYWVTSSYDNEILDSIIKYISNFEKVNIVITSESDVSEILLKIRLHLIPVSLKPKFEFYHYSETLYERFVLIDNNVLIKGFHFPFSYNGFSQPCIKTSNFALETKSTKMISEYKSYSDYLLLNSNIITHLL